MTMKLKRKLCYNTHHYQGFVRPDKVMAALRWLKKRNKLYLNIDMNNSWLEDSVKDDTELWTAMTTVPTESKDDSDEHNTTQHTDQSRSMPISTCKF